jgi:hypothetical protein
MPGSVASGTLCTLYHLVAVAKVLVSTELKNKCPKIKTGEYCSDGLFQ